MSERMYKVLIKVLEEKSFARAADLLNLTPSAVSHMIANLENRCGFKLLQRGRTEVSLTKDGEELLPFILEVLHAEERVDLEIQRMNRHKQQCLTIGTISQFSKSWLPKVIDEFQVSYPMVALNIIEGTSEELARWVKQNVVDLSLRVIDKSENNQVNVTRLYEEELLCVVPLYFFPLHENYILPEDLRNCPIITNWEGETFDYLKSFRERGYMFDSKIRVKSDESVVVMVECFFGVGILPEKSHLLRNLKEETLKRLQAFSFEPKVYRTVGIELAAEPSHLAKMFLKRMKNLFLHADERKEK